MHVKLGAEIDHSISRGYQW